MSIVENMRLTDCYYEKKDWRKCTAEVSSTSDLESRKPWPSVIARGLGGGGGW